MMLEKLQRAHHTWQGHFAPAYLVVSKKLRAYLFFIYANSQMSYMTWQLHILFNLNCYFINTHFLQIEIYNLRVSVYIRSQKILTL